MELQVSNKQLTKRTFYEFHRHLNLNGVFPEIRQTPSKKYNKNGIFFVDLNEHETTEKDMQDRFDNLLQEFELITPKSWV